MIGTGKSADIERFRSAVADRLGLQFEDAKLGFLAEVLRRRLNAGGQPLEAYLARLEGDRAPEELGVLAQELTVPETYFFRNPNQYRAFTEIALRDRLAARSTSRRLRVLSAGCASGEEAYSLAILAREGVDPSWDVSIVGVDVNPAMLTKARRGRYSAWALRETPADIQPRWFRPDGREFRLDEGVRAAVQFEARNLAQDDPQLWRPDTYDVVFCRNVLMYFTPGQAQAAIARITRALTPGGYLFLGHAETLRGLSNDFHLHHTHGTFYYQRKDRLESPALPPIATARTRELMPAVVAAVESADSWIEAIHRATERIEVLTGATRPPAPASSLAAKPDWDLGRAFDLLREERFTDALETMHQLPPQSRRDPDVLLLSAALHTHRGRLAEAEQACTQLLEVDELSAGAHYLLALCREGVRDNTGAAHHDQAAIYLDPGFAMPHLHLGLLARRAGECDLAQRELGQALMLLQREDSSRLLLFGGGFSRDTLIALCRTALVGCGGKP